MEKRTSIILIGPASPYRGGISETQHQFAHSLIQKGHDVQLWTFFKLYPKILFPGSSQYSSEPTQNGLSIFRKIHAYNPKNWKKVAHQLNEIKPQIIVFRYYTPLLSFCYRGIIKHLNKEIHKIAFVDNWIAHEKRFFDASLNKFFGKLIDKFSTFSENVATQIASGIHSKPIWFDHHPIAKNLPPKIKKATARKQLGWNQSSNIVLFYGIIRKYKGLDILLQSLSKDTLVSNNIELKIVGDCYQKVSFYKKLIKKKKMDQQIQYYFQFADKTLTQLVFSAADLLVLPYRRASQSGIIPLSYHYGVPLVVSNTPGIIQTIEKDQSGLVSKDFPNDFCHTLTSALTKEKLKKFKSNIARCKKSYQWDLFTEKWLKFIHSKPF